MALRASAEAIALAVDLHCRLVVRPSPKRFVYLLRSLASEKPYVGLTSDVPMRLAAHNAGQNRSTARHRPWEVVVAIEFKAEVAAARFERYMKSGSGWAFTKRHFLA